MSNFPGVTFAQQKVTPSDDAIIRRAILPDGWLYGCDITYSGTSLTMAAGALMVCGRMIRHPSSQNWSIVDATSGYARLLITIDLTKTATKETFEQVVDSIEYATSKDGFAELEQADINTSGTHYQVVACVVSLGTGGITGIVSQLEQSVVDGSGGLNFSLVGGVTQPSDPDTNTIWVKSSTEITGYRFSPVQPSGASNGMVWIKTGTSGSAILDVLEDGTVRLYLTGCSQYISGAWVTVDAYLYQTSAWVQFGTAITYLYNAGDKCTSITGGWTSSGYSYDSRDVVAPVFGTSTMKVQCTSHNPEQVAISGTVNKISLANVDKIVINVTSVTDYGAFILSTTKAIPSNPSKTVQITATGTVTVDVSSLTGSYYLALRAISSTAQHTRGVTVSKIYMD